MKSILKLLTPVALVLSFALSAQAAEAPVALNSSQTTEGGSSPSVLDSLYLNYFGIYHGAPLNNMGSSYTVSNTGVPTKTADYFDSEVFAAYKLTQNSIVGLDAQFQLTPLLGQGVTLGDVGIKAIQNKLISYNGLTVNGNLYIQAPVGYDLSRGMDVGIKSTPSVFYNIPHSRFMLGAWNEIKDYVGVTSGKAFKLYTLPYVAYSLNHNFALDVGYEMEWDHNAGQQGMAFSTYETDLQPGVVWKITPKIIFNPYVQIFTDNQAGTDKAAVGAAISATVL